jgi:putative ABC transport system permease protein
MTRNGVMSLQLLPFRTIKVDPAVSTSFSVLLGIVGLVLVIACVNTANLLLGRSVSRRREFAVRRAVGASRWDLVRQAITETLLIAVAAGACAVVAAVWGLEWLSAAKPMNASGFWSQYARTFDYFRATLDARVLAFNFGVAFAIGIVAGLMPALYASDVDLNEALKLHAEGSNRGFRARSGRGALVLIELTLSLILLISAGLMARSFARAATIDLGFQPRGVVAMAASLERKPVAVYRELLTRISAIPGVEGATLVSAVPQGLGMSNIAMEIEGRAAPTERVRADLNVVTPEAFSTLGIRTIAGRTFTADDRENTVRVAVVSGAFARAAWPGQNPIGRHIRSPLRVAYGNSTDWTTVIGVVDDALYGAVDEPRQAVLYLSAWQPLGTPTGVSIGADTIVLRTGLSTDAAAAAVRAALRSVDPAAPISDIGSMEARVNRATSKYRFSGVMVGALGLLALVVAAIGTYAVIAFAVASRTREIGIRVALGATPRDVVGLVMGAGLRLTFAGAALGVIGAYAGSRLLSSMLLGVTPHDPVTFAVVPAVLVAVALAACYMPARRALSVDPVIALKSE